MQKSKWLTYENGLLLLLGFTFGLIFFDRNAIAVLSPFIVKDLNLSNTQFGMLSSCLALAWALSAYGMSNWSDRLGARKPFLLLSVIVFSICSAISGLAGSFLFLVLARVVMGVAEGPFLPISLAIMNVESTPNRRGVNAGLLQTFFAALLGTTLAPIVLVFLAQQYDWRVAFFLTGVPGLICALLMWKFLREPKGDLVQEEKPAEKVKGWQALAMLKEHNIMICSLVSIALVAWFLVTLTFMPLFFVNYRGFTPDQMKWVMAVMGFSTILCGFLVPALSDRIGRKPVMIIFSFIGMVTPLAALYFDGSLWLMGALMFVGWSASGLFSLFMGVIPGETVSRKLAATSMGMVVCIGELMGGFVAPWLAGWVADQSSLAAPMIGVAACAGCAGVFSMFLKETAPIKVGKAKSEALA